MRKTAIFWRSTFAAGQNTVPSPHPVVTPLWRSSDRRIVRVGGQSVEMLASSPCSVQVFKADVGVTVSRSS
jgi:hypothetical protein